MAESAGIMSGAFFVSKGELLKWLNDFFKIGYSKIEECASGAIYCQIFDSIYPGKVKLSKVNFNAKVDHEFVPNWKVVQELFAQEGIKKHVDVSVLIKGKYMDNLEFLQWAKNFWDSKYNGEPYDAVARREGAMKSFASGRKFGAKAPVATGMKKPSAPAAPAATATRAPSAAARPAAKPASEAKAAPPKAVAKPAAAAAPKKAAASSEDAGQVAELNSRLTKLRVTIEGLEKERNFYFGKLREIEVLCQTDPELDAPTKTKVLEILYATDENEDFATPADAEEQPAEDAATEEAPAEEEAAEPQEEVTDETF